MIRPQTLAVTALVCMTSNFAIAVPYRAMLLDAGLVRDSAATRTSNGNTVGYARKQGTINPTDYHALLWGGDGTTFVDLNPVGISYSFAYGVSGAFQVGYGAGTSTSGKQHALLWNGNAESVVDLNPAGFDSTNAIANSSDYQVGHGSGSATGGRDHALLWKGTANSVVDLNPQALEISHATDIFGGDLIVGYGSGNSTGGRDHALLWHGTADDVVDLNPTGFFTSYSYGTSESHQVGYGAGQFIGSGHALLWSGTATSVVDLHPTGFEHSEALGVAANLQVGWGYGAATGGLAQHALLWSGSAASVVDLQQYLTALSPALTESVALDIDATGEIVGYAYNGSDFVAVKWTPVPEPNSAMILWGAILSAPLIFDRRALPRL
jgi:hypothetical protein